MKVLCLTGESDRAEVGAFVELARQGATLHVVGNLPQALGAELKKHAVTVEHFEWSGKLSLSAIALVRRLIASFAPDIVHCFTSRALSNASAALWKNREIKLVSYRGTSGHVSWLNPGSWLGVLNPRIDAIMCVSKAVEDYLDSVGLPRRRLCTIPKGHLPEWYCAAGREALSQFAIPSDSIVISTLANMRPVKGIDTLLEAALHLPLDGTVHYLLLGEVRDPRIRVLAADSKLSGIVHLPGYRPDGSALIGACDIFVMPSREREGLPKAAIEAMCLGRPVIVSDAGGMPELVRDGIDGVVFPAADTKALAASLNSLINNSSLRADYGQRAQERIRSAYSPLSTAAKLLELYRQLR